MHYAKSPTRFSLLQIGTIMSVLITSWARLPAPIMTIKGFGVAAQCPQREERWTCCCRNDAAWATSAQVE